jgi:hypothetical protein
MEDRLQNLHIYHTSAINSSHDTTWQTCISILILACGFLGIVTWFNNVDIYHTHFFDRGWLILSYNTMRAIFALYMIWVIYVPGYALLSTAMPRLMWQEFSLIERFILGFATGLGLWHVLMLILGTFNLYYQPVMVGICLAVLVGSSKHFIQMMHEIAYAADNQKDIRWYQSPPVLSGILIGLAIAWLLLVRGLYPGGGGDYFTHYFYYYLSVIHNHGLAPNDVWYHYYYSKGAGLHFLGMLLTDPEAPEVMTFCCVAVATIALANLVYQFSPRSLWPAVCVILYVAYNLVQISGGGSEFQKTHEETSAMAIMATWVVCMYSMRPKQWEKPAFITLAALMIAAAIVTQAIAVFFAIFFAFKVVIALFKKNWRSMWFYVFLGAITTIAVMSVLLSNYLVTGLATDQALNLTWRFANLEKLNQWGVIPNIVLVAWIRDNYEMLAAPLLSLESVKQLVSFMRLDVLKPFLYITAFSLFLIFTSKQKKELSEPLIQSTLVNIISLITIFAIVSIFAGHSQSASYFRFCSFFFPLLTLFCVLSWVRVAKQWQLSKVLLPVLILICVLFSWNHWASKAHKATNDATRFMKGRYSLAEAYANQHEGHKFGGIHRGTLTAMQHTPPGSRIWSTSVDSYCMAPGCQIESIISFKLSARINDILNGTPEEAKNILREEKLNYFLYTKDALLLDVMPYSHLFNPANINKYLAIKWTDGNTYLLTWPGPGTRPLSSAFMQAYSQHLKKPEHPWFRFRESIPELSKTMNALTQSPHPWHPITFAWRNPVKGINIVNAAFGSNCYIYRYNGKGLPLFHISPSQNATVSMKELCNGKMACTFNVTTNRFGTPAKGCKKDFKISYGCSSRTNVSTMIVSGEAMEKHIVISCPLKNQKISDT